MLKRAFGSIAMCSALITPQAHADSWGCQVLLCLSNPSGPMAVKECEPPIRRLYKAIFKWRPDPFPTCALSNGQDSSSDGNYARVGPASYYDACPAGTTDAAPGAYVAAGRPPTAAEQTASASMWMYSPATATVTSGIFQGIGSGTNISPNGEGAMPTKVCVGNLIGGTMNSFNGDQNRWVNVYDRIATVSPAGDSFNINVVINGGLFTTVRPFSQSSVQTYTSY